MTKDRLRAVMPHVQPWRLGKEGWVESSGLITGVSLGVLNGFGTVFHLNFLLDGSSRDPHPGIPPHVRETVIAFETAREDLPLLMATADPNDYKEYPYLVAVARLGHGL